MKAAQCFTHEAPANYQTTKHYRSLVIEQPSSLQHAPYCAHFPKQLPTTTGVEPIFFPMTQTAAWSSL